MAVQPSVKTYTDAELQETVEIEVFDKNESEAFKVLRLLLVTHAPGFASIFKNSSVKAVKIVDVVSFCTFDMFLGWLRMEFFRYRRTEQDLWEHQCDPGWIIDGGGSHWYNDDLDPLMWGHTDMSVWSHAEVAIDIFIFAEAFDIPRLQQDAIDRLVWCHNCKLRDFVSAAAIGKAYKHTKEGSPLRLLLTDSFFHLSQKQNEVLQALPAEFLVDVLGTYRDLGTEGFGASFNACDYHEHKTEKERLDCDVRVFEMH